LKIQQFFQGWHILLDDGQQSNSPIKTRVMKLKRLPIKDAIHKPIATWNSKTTKEIREQKIKSSTSATTIPILPKQHISHHSKTLHTNSSKAAHQQLPLSNTQIHKINQLITD
jgi:hypothetical protein